MRAAARCQKQIVIASPPAMCDISHTGATRGNEECHNKGNRYQVDLGERDKPQECCQMKLLPFWFHSAWLYSLLNGSKQVGQGVRFL